MILGGYILAPTVAVIGTELIAFTRNPVLYCTANPTACIGAVDVAAGTAAGVPLTGVPVPHAVPNIETVGAKGVIDLAATRASVDDKLARYLLNADHPIGASKAKWFDSALGFNKSNADQLAKQIVFDEASAVQTAVSEQGVKFNQVIPITGLNGKVIDVTFGWIRNNDGIIRLITGIPKKNEYKIL